MTEFNNGYHTEFSDAEPWRVPTHLLATDERAHGEEADTLTAMYAGAQSQNGVSSAQLDMLRDIALEAKDAHVGARSLLNAASTRASDPIEYTY